MRLPVEAPRVSRADCSSATVSAVGEVCPRLLVDMSRGSLTDLSPTIYPSPFCALRIAPGIAFYQPRSDHADTSKIGPRNDVQCGSAVDNVSAFGDENLINPFVLGAVTAGSCGHRGLGWLVAWCSWLGRPRRVSNGASASRSSKVDKRPNASAEHSAAE